MESAPRNVLILGSTGFIGSALFERFKRFTKMNVRGLRSRTLDLSKPGSWKKLIGLLDSRTLLIHAARPRPGGKGAENFLADIQITSNVAQGLRQKRIWKAVYFSSTAVYGDVKTKKNVKESDPADPSSKYGTAKWLGENLMRDAAAAKKTPLLVLRPCMVFGPGDPGKAYGPNQFLYSLCATGSIRIFGDGRESRNYIFIDDLSAITEKLALGSHRGIFNLAGPDPKTFRQLCRDIRRISGRQFLVKPVRRKMRQASQTINCMKLRKQLTALRFTPFEEALKTTWDNDVLDN